MKREFVVSKGNKLTLEWYFNSNGKSSAFEYFQELPPKNKDKAVHLFSTLANLGQIFNKEKFRYEGDQIFALKMSPDRFLCFFYEGSKVIITNGYEKKSQKMPQRERDKALKAKADYIKRQKEGSYYG